MMIDISEAFTLTPAQRQAATLLDKNVLVTAGAGSGKTRTLVARYIALLAQGNHSPMQLVAITFTNKAAREMRNRVRQTLSGLGSNSQSGQEQAYWLDLESKMDSARIGTIHSLCGEILRTHPELVPVDPKFEVLDEGITATLRVRVIEATLTWAIQQQELRPLFDCFQIHTLENFITFALEHRLDLIEFLMANTEDATADGLIISTLKNFFNDKTTTRLIAELGEMYIDDILAADAGPKLSLQIENLLREWKEVEQKLLADELMGALISLVNIRKHYMRLNVGKRDSQAKASLKALQTHYDSIIGTWLNNAPDPNAQGAFSKIFPLMIRLLDQIFDIYRGMLVEQHALDFDDLEYFAEQLLKLPRVCEYWQQEIHALLVDEYQDTNQRQRSIIETLAGSQTGRLFVVGDDRQSIYRFRGADVTVFQETKKTLEEKSGVTLSLQETFRPHEALIQATGDLLEHIMASPIEPPPSFWIPFSPLAANHREPPPGSQGPFIELLIGKGENAASGRKTAARFLAGHLSRMRVSGQIRRWQDVALLFRATTNFPPYEDALDEAGIPYVTIAGRGFYERPEIRDLLNMLQAITDPWDDLALAGLLRSPAFGLTDVSLYLLRWPKGRVGEFKPQNLHLALKSDLDQLDLNEKEKAIRADEFINECTTLVDRLPVSELLKFILDYTDYRAIMAAGNNRFWRNVDKLLADAHNSKIVNVGTFLEYIRNLRDIGVREGEAPPDIVPSQEAEGAVQLMSVHKSKGLEFPIVVLADASYSRTNRGEVAYLLPGKGLGVKMDRFDQSPIQYSYFKQIDAQQDEAEDKRLIYVAATRAKEKLIINGHWSKRMRNCWLKQFAQAAEIDLGSLSEEAGQLQTVDLPSGEQISACALETKAITISPLLTNAGVREQIRDTHLGVGTALYLPLVSTQFQSFENLIDANDEPREYGSISQPQIAKIVGILAHKAIQRWLFPDDQGFERLMEITAINHGLVDENLRANALRTNRKLLERLQKHRLWTEIDSALEKHHEVPYTIRDDHSIDSGKVDIIYQTELGWKFVDFKVVTIIDMDHLNDEINKYHQQMARYKRAMQKLLNDEIHAQLCFLDCMEQVKIINQ